MSVLGRTGPLIVVAAFGLWAAGPTAALADGSTLQTLINQDRAQNGGLPPLAWSQCLSDIALQNAQRTANQGYLSHTNGPTLDMGCGVGSTQAGENIAYISTGIDDVQVNTMYMNSAPHRANILGNYTYVATAWVVAANGYGYNAEEFLNVASLAPVMPSLAWQSLGAPVSSGPGTAASGSRLDVFARGSDNSLQHRSFDGTSWAAWESLGGQINEAPAAVSWGAGRIDVVVRGIDNGVWHRFFNGSAWSSWENLGGQLISAPAVSSIGLNELDAFGIGTDRALWHRQLSNGSWNNWESLGGVASANPAAVSSATNRTDVFVRGGDNGVWHRAFNGSAWTAWEGLGGGFTSGPASSSWGAGRVDVFARGMDNALWHKWFDGTTWSGWQGLGGRLTSAPAAVSPTTGTVEVTVRGLDFALWDVSLSGL